MVLQNSQNNVLVDNCDLRLTGLLPNAVLFNNAGRLGFINPTSSGALFWSGSAWSFQAGLPASGAAGGSLSGNFPNPTIAARAVSFPAIQAINSGVILGRSTAAAGDIEALTPAQISALLGLGTASTANTGTAQGNVPVLQTGGTLDPAVIPSIALNTIQIVANQAARLALANVQPGDAAKQTDNGITYLLAATPATTDANWVSIGDTAIDATEITSGVFSPARLGSGTPTASNYLRGDGSWQAIPPSGGFTYQTITANQTMAIANAYITNAATRLNLLLPAVSAVGDTLRVIGRGAGGWRITQGAGQSIAYLDLTSTVGATGYVEAEVTNTQSQRGTIDLVCTVASTEWTVIGSVGVVDVV